MFISRKSASVFIAALTCSTLAIETAQAQAGGAAVPFLLISPNSRSNAMGDAGTGLADDLNALYWNPGGLAYQYEADPRTGAVINDRNGQQATLSFSRWLPQFNADLYYSYAAYGQYIESLQGMVTANLIVMNLGEFTRTAENGAVLGKFRSNEFAIGFGYSTKLSDDLGGGIQFRYIQSNLADLGASGSGVGRSGAFDIGILWRPKEFLGMDLSGPLDEKTGTEIKGKRALGLGVNLQNIGPSMTYNAQSDPLPSMLRLGAGVNVLRDEFNDLTFCLDVSKLLVKRDSTGADRIPNSFITSWQNGGLEVALGMEYWYDNLIALRAGYFNEPARTGNRKYFTFGAGVRLDMFGFDFSFINPTEVNHPLANTLRFTLMVDWGFFGGKSQKL